MSTPSSTPSSTSSGSLGGLPAASPRKALILAAGRGERMRPLTLTTPKPLLSVGGRMLIEWHLHALARAGIGEVIVNISHLRDRFEPALGNGDRFGLRIHYSDEGPEPLETGGGMLHARTLLGEAPFVLVNGDIFADIAFETLPSAPHSLAHLIMVPNPPQHPGGDFWLAPDGRMIDAPVGDPSVTGTERLTYSGIGVFRAAILDDWRAVIGATLGADSTPPRFALAPLLRAAMARGQISGQRHDGIWHDVGTPERLAMLDAAVRAAPQIIA